MGECNGVMTRSIVRGGVVAVAAFALGCDAITQVDRTTLRTVEVSSLRTDPNQWKQVEEDLREGRSCVFVVHKGETIPVETHITLPMATLQTSGNALVFTEETYFLVSQSSLRISRDGQRWADIDDIRAQRELFGFHSGQVAFGFSASAEAGAKFSLDVKTK